MSSITGQVPSCCEGWSQLPQDILFSVFMQLDCIRDQGCFSRVCCAWQDLANSIASPPCLLIPQKTESTTHSFLPYPYSNILTYEFPEMHDKCLYHTFRGSWFLMLGFGPEVILFNPVTSNKIRLPPLTTIDIVHFDASKTEKEYTLSRPSEGGYPAESRTSSLQSMRHNFIMQVIMSSSSKNPRSEMVMITIRGCRTRAYYCKPGDEQWSKLPLYLAEIYHVAYSTGHFYIMDFGGRIQVASCSELSATSDPTKLSLSLLEVPKDKRPDPRAPGCFLIGSKRGLFLIRDNAVDKPETDFDVFSLEASQQHGFIWRKLNNVDDLGFFICNGREGLSFSFMGDVHQFKANKIYRPAFPRLDDDAASQYPSMINPEVRDPYTGAVKQEKNFPLRCEIIVSDWSSNVSGRCPTEWIVEWKDHRRYAPWFTISFD